jgi:hypothetical protein
MISISPSRPPWAAFASGAPRMLHKSDGVCRRFPAAAGTNRPRWSGRQGSRTLIRQERNRFSKAARQTVSGYLPFLFEWTAGESNPDFLVAGQVSFRWTSSPGNNPFQVTEVGVEPTYSRGSRPRRFSGLRTRPRWPAVAYPAPHGRQVPTRPSFALMFSARQVAGPGVAPGDGAYETPLGTGPPATSVASFARSSDQGESRTPKPVRARRSERRVFACFTTWSSQ